MKKIISILLLLSMICSLGLTSCKKTPIPPQDEDSLTVSPPEEDSLPVPPNYKNILEVYQAIITSCSLCENIDIIDFDNLITEMPKEIDEKTYNNLCSAVLLNYPRNSHGLLENGFESFGYALKDINNDGIQELILMLNDYTIITIISMVDGAPVVLDWYYPKKVACFTKGGEIIVCGSNGAYRSEYEVYCLESNKDVMLLKTRFGLNGINDDGEIIYFSNQESNIGEDQFKSLLREYLGENYENETVKERNYKNAKLNFRALWT